ncbi:hypothetical protein HYC85_011155 [Camellia sinensis]|uniref:Uncharacterized protein n=1 Tax=Camellia sinensis TaxID=4442 RepID=A0A7J7HLY5_CAMSI|nr:hypothetical protein HYC85_011155 [Camellia sinensis]
MLLGLLLMGRPNYPMNGFGPWMLVKKKCKRPHHLGRGREDNKLGKRPQNANQIRWGLRPMEQTDNPNLHMLPSGKISTPLEKMLIVGENFNTLYCKPMCYISGK